MDYVPVDGRTAIHFLVPLNRSTVQLALDSVDTKIEYPAAHLPLRLDRNAVAGIDLDDWYPLHPLEIQRLLSLQACEIERLRQESSNAQAATEHERQSQQDLPERWPAPRVAQNSPTQPPSVRRLACPHHRPSRALSQPARPSGAVCPHGYPIRAPSQPTQPLRAARQNHYLNSALAQPTQPLGAARWWYSP